MIALVTVNDRQATGHLPRTSGAPAPAGRSDVGAEESERSQLLADANPVTGGDQRTRDVAVLVIQCGCESPQGSPCTARIQ